MTLVWPDGRGGTTPPHATSEFQPARKNPVTGIVQAHNGIDLIGFDQIKSPVNGVVSFSGYNGTAGNEVRIREDGTGTIYRLLHNRALNVRTGQRVSAGEVVAWMGSTGQSTGPHCHFETKPNNTAVNPRGYYQTRNATGRPAGLPGKDQEEEDMTPEQDTRLKNIEALLAGTGNSLQNPEWRAGHGSVLNHLQNLSGFVFAGGTSTQDPEYFGAPGTIYALLKSPVRRVVDGKQVVLSQVQDNADTNTMVRELLKRPAVQMTDEQVALLAKALKDAGAGGASKEEIQTLLASALASLVLSASVKKS